MRMILASLVFPAAMLAQLPAPNSMGVGMGHLHLNTKDPVAARRFWVEFMGAPATSKLGDNDIYKFPDVLVFVRKSDKLGTSEGSAVNHLGFKVKSLEAYLAKANSMGIPIVKRLPETRQAFVMNPDEVKVELSEDAAMSGTVAHHHIHFFNPAYMETRAWYAKTFGAIPGRRGKFDAADLPGVNLTFSVSEQPVVPTKGRAMDHIGFEVKNLEAFVKKMEAAGVKFDVPYRHVPKLGLSIAFFVDPWGTYVELTEGLSKF